MDTGITIDSNYGYSISADNNIITPFSGYSGTDKIKVQTGNPHPYLSYHNMGIPLAAFIQKHR